MQPTSHAVVVVDTAGVCLHFSCADSSLPGLFPHHDLLKYYRLSRANASSFSSIAAEEETTPLSIQKHGFAPPAGTPPLGRLAA